MDLAQALTELLPVATPWFAIAWLTVGSLRHLQAGAFVSEWVRPWLALRWARQLRKLGASEKETRQFLKDYALKTRA